MTSDDELEKKLLANVEEAFRAWDLMGALPTFIAEAEYGALNGLMGDRMPKKYMGMIQAYYVATENHRLPRDNMWRKSWTGLMVWDNKPGKYLPASYDGLRDNVVDRFRKRWSE